MYGIIGSSPCMRKLFKLIERVASTQSTVLIQGESGTGKELIARAIHMCSPSPEKPLIPVNCGAIPENLLESELFGHVRGAFTGATHSRMGRFEVAHGGTLFLDEIGDMSPKLQVKMLRVLQEKTIEPVGSVKSIKVDVRVIAATHKNLEREVEEGRFREDLFYRLNVVPLHVPSLRERLCDLPELVRHFLNKAASNQGCLPLEMAPEMLEVLGNYSWPGNVRELENLMERLTILSDGQPRLEDLPAKVRFGGRTTGGNPASPPAGSMRTGLGDTPHPTLASFGLGDAAESGEPSPVDFNHEVEMFENRLILDALQKTDWNKNKAAQLLNLNRTTLVEKIKKKGLEQLER
ncbi:MAG: sigma-54 dependent transcriptional regulator [Magnetococcus sp. WYHC-3]